MLREKAYIPYTAKEIRPEGWLRRQLQLEADGLVGNLDKIWPDVRDSRWIGGDRGLFRWPIFWGTRIKSPGPKPTSTRSWRSRSRTAGSAPARMRSAAAMTCGRCC